MPDFKKPKLIVIDGIDGSGKATQTKLLIEKLRLEQIPTETIDFPQYQNNFFGGMVRQYLDGKFGTPTQINPKLASTLYAADRWESSQKIKDWINENKLVVVDRYSTSNLIHQGAKMTEDQLDEFIGWIDQLEFKTFQIPQPDLVIFLHVDPKTSYNLITKRGQGHDGHDTMEHLTVAEKRCLYMAKKLGWQTVECCQDGQILPIEKIQEKIWAIVKDNI
ncbi:MAG: dTMP kinase [Candidatus Buchananbacteria bacterium]|nr:dTMP kinase [Candidatus Buchananbacteria bacterium]